jgi:hypothetical protein
MKDSSMLNVIGVDMVLFDVGGSERHGLCRCRRIAEVET